MRKPPLLIACLVAALATFVAIAKSGPPIPKPAVQMAEAIDLAKAALLTGKGLSGLQAAKPQDYMLMGANYERDVADLSLKSAWHWEILFAHPIHNDHTALYTVTMARRVHLISATE